METRATALAEPEHGSRLEALLALLPFLLGALISLTNLLNTLHLGIPPWLSNGWALVVLIAFMVGLIARLPRWSLPYAGVLGLNLSWILMHRGTFMGLNTRAGLLGPLLGWIDRLVLLGLAPSTPRAARWICGTGLDWIALLALTACAVIIASAFRPLRPLLSRIRDDWTLLSFALYGATVMAVFYTFEDYPPARYPFMVLSSLILAAGAWAYLRTGRPGAQGAPTRRALTLFAAMILAMIVGASGKAAIYASPAWPYPYSFTWRSEALHAVLLWGWVIVVVMAPALLSLLPRSRGPLELAKTGMLKVGGPANG